MLNAILKVIKTKPAEKFMMGRKRNKAIHSHYLDVAYAKVQFRINFDNILNTKSSIFRHSGSFSFPNLRTTIISSVILMTSSISAFVESCGNRLTILAHTDVAVLQILCIFYLQQINKQCALKFLKCST